MERIHDINPGRIQWCCDERGITVVQLANDTGIATSTLERAMAGEVALTFGQLSRVAAYFNRGALFFLETEPVDEERIHSPQFRTLANQKPEISPRVREIIERAEWQRDVYVSLREDLYDGDVLAFNPPEIPENPKDAAGLVRAWLTLEGVNTFEAYRTAVERKGVLVFRSNGYHGKWQIPKDNPILGFSLYDQSCPLIVVKKQKWDARQTFTLMHELGHLLLHKASSIDDEQDLQSREGHEREANAFAGNVLVPDEKLATIRDEQRPVEVSQYDEWLLEKRREWGVSSEVILRRLLDENRLPRVKYTAYREWWHQQAQNVREDDGGSRMYRHREPKHLFGDRFVRTVLDAVHARQITLTKASSYLDSLKISDLHQLERHYAGL